MSRLLHLNLTVIIMGRVNIRLEVVINKESGQGHKQNSQYNVGSAVINNKTEFRLNLLVDVFFMDEFEHKMILILFPF